MENKLMVFHYINFVEDKGGRNPFLENLREILGQACKKIRMRPFITAWCVVLGGRERQFGARNGARSTELADMEYNEGVRNSSLKLHAAARSSGKTKC